MHCIISRFIVAKTTYSFSWTINRLFPLQTSNNKRMLGHTQGADIDDISPSIGFSVEYYLYEETANSQGYTSASDINFHFHSSIIYPPGATVTKESMNATQLSLDRTIGWVRIFDRKKERKKHPFKAFFLLLNTQPLGHTSSNIVKICF